MRSAATSRTCTRTCPAIWATPASDGASTAPDHAGDLRLRLEPRRVAPPRGFPSFGREQPALLRQDHPGEPPPVRHHVAGAPVDQVVAVLARERGGALPGEAVEERMVLGRQALVVEVVERVAPDAPAHGVERPVDAVVVAALAQPLELDGVLRQPHDIGIIY